MHKRFISLILAVVTVIGLPLPSYAEGGLFFTEEG